MCEEVHVTVEFNMEFKQLFSHNCLGCVKVDCTRSCLLSHLLVVYNACGYSSWKLGLDLNMLLFSQKVRL